MRRRHRLIVTGIFGAMILMSPVVLLLRQGPDLYTVTTLPSPGGAYRCPDAINDRGQIVGSSMVGGSGLRLFLWDRARGIQDLGPIEGPADINNEGQIAGTMVDPNGQRQAFLLTPGGQRRLLGTLGGSTSIAMALNNRGQVVGESWTAAGINHAFLWDETHGMRDLSPPETRQSLAYAINDRGQVLVFSPQRRVSLWDPNAGFVGQKDQALGATFGALNNQGRAVFRRRLPNGRSRLVTSETGSDWKTLFELEGDAGRIRLNDAGQVLFQETRAYRYRWLNRLFARRLTQSCLLDPRRGLVLLCPFVPYGADECFYPQDMNNRGDIVGLLTPAGRTGGCAVLLEPIPERWRR